MSSYLTFYTKPKDGSKPVDLVSFSRSTEIYQYFNDLFRINDEFFTLTKEHVQEVLACIASDLYKTKRRLETYEQYAHINADLVEEVIGIKEYIGQLTKTKFQVEFIALLVNETNFSYSLSSEICCTIR